MAPFRCGYFITNICNQYFSARVKGQFLGSARTREWGQWASRSSELAGGAGYTNGMRGPDGAHSRLYGVFLHIEYAGRETAGGGGYSYYPSPQGHQQHACARSQPLTAPICSAHMQEKPPFAAPSFQNVRINVGSSFDTDLKALKLF